MSKDVLPLFLDASTEWQINCCIISGGLTLAYFLAKMESFQNLVSQRIIKTDRSNNRAEHWVQILLVPMTSNSLEPCVLLDYKQKLTDMGLPFEVFEPGKPKELTGTTNLVIVAANCVNFSSWQEAIATLNRLRPVVHQNINEAHIPLLNQDF